MMADIEHIDPARWEEEGKKLYQAGKYQGAAGAFSKAADFYLGGGDETRAAEMRNNICVSLIKMKDPKGALEAVRGTAAVFRAAGQTLNAAMALANEATALQDLDAPDQAIDRFKEAAELFVGLGEQEMYLQTMQSISGIKFKQRNIPGALISMQEGLEGLEKPTLRQRLLRNLLKLPQSLLDK